MILLGGYSQNQSKNLCRFKMISVFENMDSRDQKNCVLQR